MDLELPILVAEDNDDDVFILQAALKRAGVNHPIHICKNGQEVIDYLIGEGFYSNRQRFPFPRLLLMDLKMPVRNGFEVLRWLGDEPPCPIVPTIVLTSSRHQEDVALAYRLGANAYMVKPGRLQDFEKLLALVHQFWTACELPPICER